MKREKLYNVKTGDAVERYPVDAREMLLTGEWTRRRPAKVKGDEEDDADSKPAPRKSEREERIEEALASVMESGNTSIITNEGYPHVSAVSRAAGFEVTAEERNAAWRQYEASRR